MQVLIVEDESAISSMLEFRLRRDRYQVLIAETGEDALTLYAQHDDIELIILDVMLPGKLDGFDVLREIRAQEKEDPPQQPVVIILSTAKTQDMDRINGLMFGADDYLSKPYQYEELLLRYKKIRERMGPPMPKRAVQEGVKELTSGPFRLDLELKSFWKNGEQVELTQVEFVLLKYLLSHKGISLSRDDILNAVWGEEYFGETKIVDVNIHRLRNKLEEDPTKPVYMLTVWGVGYKWNEPQE